MGKPTLSAEGVWRPFLAFFIGGEEEEGQVERLVGRDMRYRERRRWIHVPLLTDPPQRSTSESSEKMDASRLEKKEKQLISPTKERRET